MADKKISALTGATTPLAGSEVLPIVQGGSTVKVSVDNLTAGKAVSANSLNVNSPSLVQKLTVTGALSGNNAADCGMAILRAGTTFGSNLYHTYSTQTFSDAFGITVNENTTLTDPQYTKYLIGSNGTHIWYGGTTAAEFARFDTSGNFKATTGNFVVGTAGKGIDFSANTHAAGMTSELLNDYEEGTFTPSLQFGGGSTGLVYNAQNGWYTKIGNQVTAVVFIQIQQVGSSTGNATVAGLPYTSANVNDKLYTHPVSLENSTGLTGAPFGILDKNSTTIAVYQTAASGRANVTHANFQTFALNNIYIVTTYMVS